MNDIRQGVVHIIGPEQGFTLPGMTIVCGDSHTSTHGAFGALAFGIGTSEVEHVLATQCLVQKRPKTMEVRVEGTASSRCSAKDVILAIIGNIGTAGGTGYVIEYTGSTIRALSMEGRMTLCNMSIEGGARAGMVAPDDTTVAYIKGRPMAPRARSGIKLWRPGSNSRPILARDTMPWWNCGPKPSHPKSRGYEPEEWSPVWMECAGPSDHERREAPRSHRASSRVYGVRHPGTPIRDIKIDKVFIGSCTNARIEDLRLAASFAKGRKVAGSAHAMVVPGSGQQYVVYQ